MEFSDFLTLHHSVQTATANQLKTVVSTLDSNSIRQLLLVYCRYFLNPELRNKYINDNEHISNNHHLKIITKLKEKTKLNRSSNENVFSKLPLLLTSRITSFLDNSSRLRTSSTNNDLFKASNQSISRSHIKINKSFIESKLCKKNDIFNINEYKNMSSITVKSSKCIKRGGKKKRNIFLSNFGKIFNESSETLKYLNIDRHVEMNQLPKDLNFKQLISFKTTVYRWNHTNFIPSFWINQSVENIEISNNNIINKCLIKESQLKHLELSGYSTPSKCDQRTTGPHPIFWLWNIPNLESCDLSLTLPNSNKFKEECDKLLSSSIIVNKSQNQKKFRSLTLRMTKNSGWGQPVITEHQLNEDLNVFLKCLTNLYPNLTSIKYTLYIFGIGMQCCSFSKPLDWNGIFNNILEIKIDILSTKIASNFLLYLKNHKTVRVCHLNGIRPKRTRSEQSINAWNVIYFYDPFNDFIDNICEFMENAPNSLHSFGIEFRSGNVYKNMKDEYFGAYKKYLECLLNLMERKNKIFDGYLKLKLPQNRCGMNTKYGKRNKENIDSSLKISQLISRIQIKINQFNIKNSDNQKRTILHLPQLRTYSKHLTFLRFWFNDDPNLYEDNKFVMF